jgi:pyruvate dehydrogenase (quinone)
MVMGCDTLFMVGTSFPYAEWPPPEGQARGVEIDIDGQMVGIRYLDVHLVGDAKKTLRALLPHLTRKENRDWQRFITSEVETWWRILDDQSHIKADPVNPQLVAYELDRRLPDGVILTADSDWTGHALSSSSLLLPRS